MSPKKGCSPFYLYHKTKRGSVGSAQPNKTRGEEVYAGHHHPPNYYYRNQGREFEEVEEVEAS